MNTNTKPRVTVGSSRAIGRAAILSVASLLYGGCDSDLASSELAKGDLSASTTVTGEVAHRLPLDPDPPELPPSEPPPPPPAPPGPNPPPPSAISDFSCLPRGSGELSVGIFGPCEAHSWGPSGGQPWTSNSQSSPNDYFYTWFVEYDLGHKLTSPIVIASGRGVSSTSSLSLSPDDRARLTVQVKEISGSERSGVSYMDVKGIQAPNSAYGASPSCGSTAGVYPFGEPQYGKDGKRTGLYKCYVRNCTGGKSYRYGNPVAQC